MTRGLLQSGRTGAGVRHPARRAGHPRAGARRRVVGAAADPGDPVPRLPAQRRGPDPRRRRHAAVLLEPAVPQPDGGARRRLRLPEGLRRALPQRQRASPRCATSPASSSPRRPVPTTPPRCCTPASRRPERPASCASTSSRSRSTTPGTCTTTATSVGSHRIRTAGTVPIGRARTYGDGTDLTILTFGNGVRMSLRVARRLERVGIAARVVDLRWLAPLPVADMMREADATGRVLVVDETRRTGGVGEGVLAALVQHGFTRRRRPSRQRGQLHPARRRRTGGAAVRGDHRGRCRSN